MDLMELLQKHDDPRRWESPIRFDYESATRRFAAFTEVLSAVLGLPLGLPLNSETRSHIQDASFHSQIYVRLDAERNALSRFSNFGDLATVSEDEPIPEEILKTIVGLLEKHGYIYVPASILDQPYTGKNPGVTGIRNWWIRFFDWV